MSTSLLMFKRLKKGTMMMNSTTIKNFFNPTGFLNSSFLDQIDFFQRGQINVKNLTKAIVEMSRHNKSLKRKDVYQIVTQMKKELELAKRQTKSKTTTHVRKAHFRRHPNKEGELIYVRETLVNKALLLRILSNNALPVLKRAVMYFITMMNRGWLRYVSKLIHQIRTELLQEEILGTYAVVGNCPNYLPLGYASCSVA